MLKVGKMRYSSSTKAACSQFRETAIETPDGNRKQVRSTHQEVLYCRAAEIRIKVQRPTAIVALQIVDLGPRRAPSKFERVPPMVRLRPERSLKRFSVLIRGNCIPGPISASS